MAKVASVFQLAVVVFQSPLRVPSQITVERREEQLDGAVRARAVIKREIGGSAARAKGAAKRPGVSHQRVVGSRVSIATGQAERAVLPRVILPPTTSRSLAGALVVLRSKAPLIAHAIDGKRADAKARRERRARGDGDAAGDRACAFNQAKSAVATAGPSVLPPAFSVHRM